MARSFIKSGAFVFLLLVNDKVVTPYSNLKAVYAHFCAVVQPGYTKHVSYSQLSRKFKKIDCYDYLSSDRIKYTIQLYIAQSKYEPLKTQ